MFKMILLLTMIGLIISPPVNLNLAVPANPVQQRVPANPVQQRAWIDLFAEFLPEVGSIHDHSLEDDSIQDSLDLHRLRISQGVRNNNAANNDSTHRNAANLNRPNIREVEVPQVVRLNDDQDLPNPQDGDLDWENLFDHYHDTYFGHGNNRA